MATQIVLDPLDEDVAYFVNQQPGDGCLAKTTDGGATFSAPMLICGNVLYDQGSRPVVGPDGTIHALAGTGVQTGSVDGEGGDPSDDLHDDGPAFAARSVMQTNAVIRCKKGHARTPLLI